MAKRLLLALVFLGVCLLPVRAWAQELMPGAKYDAKIPTLKAVLGWDFGEEITSPEGITTYLRALHDAAPDRTRLIEYARTWEKRPLHVLVVGAPQRLAQLDAVKQGLKRLADPRGVDRACQLGNGLHKRLLVLH